MSTGTGLTNYSRKPHIFPTHRRFEYSRLSSYYAVEAFAFSGALASSKA